MSETLLNYWILPQGTCIVNTNLILKVRLREAMDLYRIRTGHRLTYEDLALLCGLSVATLQSLGTRPNYNTRLSSICALCAALGCQPGELLELIQGEE